MSERQIRIDLGQEPMKECGVIDIDGTRCTTMIPTNRVACACCCEALQECLNYLVQQEKRLRNDHS